MVEQKREEMKKLWPVSATLFFNRDGPSLPICCVGVVGHTNLVAYKPLPEEAFDAKLFNQNGEEVSKAWFNPKFGQPLKPDKKLLDGSFLMDSDAMFGNSRELNFTNWDGSNHYWDFNIVKSFRVKKAGEYRLQVQVRLFVKDTNGVFQPFILPAAVTNVTILNSDLSK